MKKGNTKRSLFIFTIWVSCYFLFVAAQPATPVFSGNMPGINDTIFVYDTIEVFDIIYIYDTIFIKDIVIEPVFEEDTLIKNGTLNKRKIEINKINDSKLAFYNFFAPIPPFKASYSVGAYFGQSINIPVFSGNSAYDEVLFAQRQASSASFGYSAGLLLTRHGGKNSLSTGISIANINTSFWLESKETFTDTSWFYKYTTQSELQIDTVWFLNLEQLLATGDSMWYAYPDSTYITKLDSTLITKIDTSFSALSEKSKNQYTFLEIPFLISFPIHTKKIDLYPETGIIANIIMNSHGKLITLKDINKSEPINPKKSIVPITFSYFMALGINYTTSPKVSLTAKAFFKQDLTSLLNQTPIKLKHRTFGFQVGLRYKFRFHYY